MKNVEMFVYSLERIFSGKFDRFGSQAIALPSIHRFVICFSKG